MTRLALSSLSLLVLLGCGDDSMVRPCGLALCPGDASPDAPDDGGAADAGPDGLPPDSGTSAPTEAVVDAAWLRANIDDPAVSLVDVRSAAAYEAAHVEGALLVDPGSLRATVDGVPGQVADAAAVTAALSSAGLSAGGTVVVYGAASEPTPARVVWTLLYHGHEDARLLDGGFPSWEEIGGSTASGASTATAGDWSAGATVDSLRSDVDYILPRLDDPAVVLVDARTRTEYDAGHIPGALSIDWNENVSGGAYRPLADVEALYADIDRDATVIAYCQTGTRAALDWITLRWLGFRDARLYDGSWAEWGSRAELPRE